jgi:hypothetical protein
MPAEDKIKTMHSVNGHAWWLEHEEKSGYEQVISKFIHSLWVLPSVSTGGVKVVHQDKNKNITLDIYLPLFLLYINLCYKWKHTNQAKTLHIVSSLPLNLLTASLPWSRNGESAIQFRQN